MPYSPSRSVIWQLIALKVVLNTCEHQNRNHASQTK
uniref:Uncharacterized protein n=1 Tax=Arundo donax TaxID=35708 RepID=A0A0A9G320_ARUDO